MDQNLPLITVAVPVYNSEGFLEECLNSIVNQTYTNLDILLVNDGSTDRTVEICEEFKKNDSRVRLITKQNGGVGSSRNLILEVMNGEYVTFVDNDDWLDIDHIKYLYEELIDHDADIVASNFSEYISEEDRYDHHDEFVNYFEVEYTSRSVFSLQYNAFRALSQVFTVPWGKLFKVSLFNNVAFPENETVEDDYTTYFVYLAADMILYTHRETYIHRKSGHEVTKTANIVDVCPLKSIEERLTVLATLGFDISGEINTYKIRLRMHQEAYLKNGNVVEYKRITKKINLIEKYSK